MSKNQISEYERGFNDAVSGKTVDAGAGWEYIAGWEDGDDVVNG